MKFINSIIVLWLLAQNGVIAGRIIFNSTDLLDSAGTIALGLSKELKNIIPTPQQLFQLPVQVLVGLPEQAVFQTLNQLCSLYLAADTINPRITPKIEEMALRLRTPCKEQKYSLTEIDDLLDSPDFDVSKKVAIFVTGWMSNPEEDYVTEMAQAFNCRGNYNFLAFDSSIFIDTLYTWSAYNTKEIGRQFALALSRLADEVPAENIHLIGHSLGAHIVGYAGQYFSQYTGLNISRITGLDPANPCFNEGEILSGLQRGDASFVDVIHTNPGVLGKKNPVGDVDFYAGGLAPIKPGCIQFGCSHSRAFQFFTESVFPGNEYNFLGTRCTSLTKLEKGFCEGPQYPMGFAVPYNLKGNYFLPVNAKPPYGKNHGDNDGQPRECGRCRASS